MNVSIYDALRGNKVVTGGAAMYQGMRTFDESAQVCPTRANVSDYGIADVARDSINTYAPGCFSALDRVTVENVLRPRYAVYLNASAIADPGVGDDDYSTTTDQASLIKPLYDTQLPNQYVRPVVPNMENQQYYDKFTPVPNAPINAQIRETQKVDCFMGTGGNQYPCNATKLQ